MGLLRMPRGLKAALESMRAGSSLLAGEIRYATDEGAMYLATGVNTMSKIATTGDVSAVSFATTRVFEKKTGNFNAAAFYRYRCETGAGAITATLPASPADGDIITIRRKGANSVVVGRNGKTIAGLAEDLTIDADKREIDLKYNGTTSDWEVEARAYV